MKRNQVVVITGASAGVGRAIAQAFARRGARIGLIARGRERLETAAREIEALGGHALIFTADVADSAGLESAADQIEKTFGSIDVWINNAMASVFSPVKQMSPDEFRRVTEVTYLGVVNGTLAALRRMLPRDRGTIVQVGSALAYRSIPLQSAYCAAKHAVKGFTDSLRSELIHDHSNVRLTAVHLPALNTPQFEWVKSRLFRRAQPVPPIFQPELAARAIVWAADHAPRELLVGFSTVQAVWANKFLPGYLDRYLARFGYDSQQTTEPEDPKRAFNLWEPVAGDFSAHGRFDARARRTSLQLWLRTHLRTLALGTAVLAGFTATAVSSRGVRRSHQLHPRKGRRPRLPGRAKLGNLARAA